MPDFGGFAKIAPYLTHPLVLAGFALLLLFGLLRALLKSQKVAVLTQKSSGQLLLRAVNFGFLAAVLVILLGFGLAFYQTQRTTVDADQIIRDLKAATEKAAASEGKLDNIKRLTEALDSNALRDAIVALLGQSGNPTIARAIELLRQGDTGAAETVLSEISTGGYRTALRRELPRSRQPRRRRKRRGISARSPISTIPPRRLKHIGPRVSLTRVTLMVDLIRPLVPSRSGNLAARRAKRFWSAQQAAREGGAMMTTWGIAFERSGGRPASPRRPPRGRLDAYQARHNIIERLAAQDPGNAGWQRDLSVSFNKIGEVQSAKGDLDGALKAYQEDLAIAQKLAAQDPGNAGWQRDLIVSNVKLGEIAEAQDPPRERGGPSLSGRARDCGRVARQPVAWRRSTAGWSR